MAVSNGRLFVRLKYIFLESIRGTLRRTKEMAFLMPASGTYAREGLDEHNRGQK